jgi:hypothetical protein
MDEKADTSEATDEAQPSKHSGRSVRKAHKRTPTAVGATGPGDSRSPAQKPFGAEDEAIQIAMTE